MLPGCFSIVNQAFAFHSSEKEQARKTIKEAKEAGVTKEEFQKEFLWYLWKQDLHESTIKAHITKQLKRLDKMWPVKRPRAATKKKL